jgi:DNA-binding HxlR family transcriptional regulator
MWGMNRSAALDYDTANCTIEAALRIIGEKWTFIVLREAFSGVRRFDDIRRRTQAPRQVLSTRLASLVEDGLLRKVLYHEPGQRSRHEYRLTGKGLDLYPVIVALMAWGDKYAVSEAGPPTLLRHRDCGAPVSARLCCDEGHMLDGARDVLAIPGPGAQRITAQKITEPAGEFLRI